MHKIKQYYQTVTNNITTKIQRDAEIHILHWHADSTSDSDAQLGNSSSSYHTLISNLLQEKPTLHCSMSRSQTQAQKTVFNFFFIYLFFNLPCWVRFKHQP